MKESAMEISRREFLQKAGVGSMALMLSRLPGFDTDAILNDLSPQPDPLTALAGTMPICNVKDFGARGDGVANDAQAIQAAIDSAQASGCAVYFPSGTYLIEKRLFVYANNMILFGDGPTSILIAKPGIFNVGDNLGLLTTGWKPPTGENPHPVPVDKDLTDLLIRDLTFDGQHLITPIHVGNVTRGRLDQVTARNSDTGVIRVLNCTDLVVHRCTASGGRGRVGDGIYFQVCTRPAALFNHVSDITRIGIVTEGYQPTAISPITPSWDALILGNDIRYTHDSQYPESNAAIWLEATNGGRVMGNHASNLFNHPAPNTRVSGIVIGSGQTEKSVFEITDNEVSEVEIGLSIGAAPSRTNNNPQATSTVNVDGFTVERGTRGFYDIGVYISSAKAVVMRHLRFGDNRYTEDSAGGITVDLQKDNDMDALVIESSSVGSMVHTASSADFNLWRLNGRSLLRCVLAGLKNWKIQMRDGPSDLSISDCSFVYNGTVKDVYGLRATDSLLVRNAMITSLGGPNLFGSPARQNVFAKVVFKKATPMYLNNASTGTDTFQFEHCRFVEGTSLYFNATVDVYATGSSFEEYGSDGAIRINGVDLPSRLFVRACSFRHRHDVTPLQRWNYDPTATVLIENTYTSSLLHNFQTNVYEANNKRVKKGP